MKSDGMRELALLRQAKQALSQANNFEQIKAIRDNAEVVRKRAQSNSLGLDVKNRAAEVKLRAERLAGKRLSELMLRGGDRRSPTRHERLKLGDLGISRNQSTRWQIQARVPEKVFCEYVEQTCNSGQELTAANLMRIAKLIDEHSTIRVATGNDQGNHSNGFHHNGVNRYPKTNGHIRTNGHASPNSFHPHEEASRLAAIAEIVSDLKNHHQMLTGIVAPICDNEDALLKPVERRMLQYLLGETRQLFDRLGTLQPKQMACACHNHA